MSGQLDSTVDSEGRRRVSVASLTAYERSREPADEDPRVTRARREAKADAQRLRDEARAERKAAAREARKMRRQTAHALQRIADALEQMQR